MTNHPKILFKFMPEIRRAGPALLALLLMALIGCRPGEGPTAKEGGPGGEAEPEVTFTPVPVTNPGPVDFGDTVTVHYTAMHTDGQVFESTEQNPPFTFTVGDAKVIRGLEKAVIGMKPGETKTVTIPMEDAYGPVRNDLIQVKNRLLLTGGGELKVGREVTIRQPDGSSVRARIIDLNDFTVTFDANHPLAGKDIKMSITLEEIRREPPPETPSSEEER